MESFAEKLGISGRIPGKYYASDDLPKAIANAWFVIEAIPEKLDLKVATFEELSRSAPSDCIFGSDSSSYKSSLIVRSLDEDTQRRSLNVHYMMPPGNRIVELMTSTYTEENIFEFLIERHKDIGLLPVVVRKESTGYVPQKDYFVLAASVA